jgi:hypothetical protein
MRSQSARIYLMAGIGLLILGIAISLLGSSFGGIFVFLGLAFLVAGAFSFTSRSVVEGTPALLNMISRHTEPEWDGEVLHTDGGAYKIRYRFDHRGQPHFVANDICLAIGAKTPHKGELKCDGVSLTIQAEHPSFSREAVEAYLMPLALKNHEANRLLTLLRNDVFRKLDKQREQAKLIA